MEIKIRQAHISDVQKMMEIEKSAAELFAKMPETLLRQLPNHLPLQNENFYQEVVDYQKSWVICFNDEPIGFCCTLPIIEENALHIEEIDVALPFQGQGLGSKLLKFIIEYASRNCLTYLTLTTFKSVSWNEYFYQKHGFKPVKKADLNERLQNILKKETLIGLTEKTRCAMVMNLDS